MWHLILGIFWTQARGSVNIGQINPVSWGKGFLPLALVGKIMTAILGISAFYHDSAAALVIDGEIVAAVQEERFTREKYDARMPLQAIAYCLQEGGLTAEKIDYVAFYDKPLTKFERLLETYLGYAPRGFASFRKAMLLWLKDKLHMRRKIRQRLGCSGNLPILFLDHHESHAASAFFPSPFEEAAILTLDGVGEWSTAAYGTGSGHQLRLTHRLCFPHSLGLLYSAFTYYCGFKVNSGEYKLMGLAPYGQPVYQDAIFKHLIDLKPDGSFWLNQKYFNYCQGLTMTNARFHKLFGGPPRKPDTAIEQRHMDLAASIQKVAEEVMLHMSRDLHRQTGMKNLVLAGGVALNCVANGRLLREGPYERIWIQPAAGDAGGALGAALFTWYQLLNKPRTPMTPDAQKGSLLGPQYSVEEIRSFLDKTKASYRRFPDEAALLDHVAEQLAAEKVVGWFHGRAEFGPRALGARSILGDARSATMQAVMNLKIKFRESFRPFAPCVLREHVHEWFGMRPGEDSAYMLLVAPVLEKHRVPLSAADAAVLRKDLDLLRRVNLVRSTVPAITHVDYSARVQTVDERHGRYQRLMKKFYEKTGCPIIVNTSFNLSWEPIVLTPQEAYHTFMQSEMDVLVLEDFVLHKTEQPLGLPAWARPDAGEAPDPARPWASPVTREPHRPPTARRSSMIDPQLPEQAPVPVSARTLRQFAALWLLILGGLAFWQGYARDHTVVAGVLAVLAVAVGFLGLLKPQAIRLIFVGATACTFPIGWAVSQVLLVILFYGVFTPVALVFKLIGRDALGRCPRPDLPTYWTPQPQVEDIRAYFHQS
jgi:carbamoyltransferase